MMRKFKNYVTLCLSFLGFLVGVCQALMAAHSPLDHDHTRCTDALGRLTKPLIRLFDSGQDAGEFPKLQDAAHHIYDVAQRLGYDIPPMVIKSMQAADMAAMLANVGHPAPHWFDGASILNMAGNAGHYLEFVETGRHSHVQFLRDTNTFEETLIVFAHVAGHYDFGVNSYLDHLRDPDRIRDSHELSELMRSLYTHYDVTEVAEFYQFLLSARYLQDMARSSYDHPDAFQPKAVERRFTLEPTLDAMGRPTHDVKQPHLKHPRAPSPSVLQALVKNLPPTAPQWKRELIEVFERAHRVGPTIIPTKIMNEGWATFAELLVLRHTKYNTGSNEVEFGQINAGVNYASLSNPYWLGLQAWMRLYDRFFKEHTECDKLSPFEKDQKFIAYAKDLIRKYTDYEFLRLALDEVWVNKWNLLLYRKKHESEGGGGWGPQMNVAITRDAKRVVDYIARIRADFDLKFPRVEIDDFNGDERGMVLLKHRPMLDVPLDRRTLSKSLFAYAKIMDRPVAIDTIGTSMWFKKPAPMEGYEPWLGASHRPWWWPPEPAPEPEPYTFSMRVVVTPKGHVEVSIPDLEKLPPEVREEYLPHLEGELQAYCDLYRLDLVVGSPEDHLDLATSARLNSLVQKALAGAGPEHIPHSVSHALSGAEAVFKYMQFSKMRADRILKLAAQGKWPAKFSKNGQFVKIRVLPEIPMFGLDTRVDRMRKKRLSPTKPNFRFRLHRDPFDQLKAMVDSQGVQETKAIIDEDLDIGSGPYLPGDEWERPKEQPGQGDGDGEEGEEGEEGEGEGAGSGSGGQGEMDDPSEVKIPISLWGEILAEQIKLRNLRRTTDGENPEKELVRFGGVRSPSGLRREDRMGESWLEKGMAIARALGKDPQTMPAEEILKLGMLHEAPEDVVVYGVEEKPLPDTDAVIVYIADTSGSMGIEHRRIERRMVAYTSAVLKTQYPRLKEAFVIYDSDAAEVSRDEFFSRSLGGGTQTKAGLDKASEVLKRYPRTRYNRFAMLFSDGDDFNPTEATQTAGEMLESLEFFAYGHVQPAGGWSGGGELSKAFKSMAQAQDEKVGYAELRDLHLTLIEALKIYFGPPKSQ